MPTLNTAALISSFVNPIFEGAMMVAREQNLMSRLVRNFNDRTGSALRHNVQNGTATMATIGESDDLTSQAYTPTNVATLTPGEIGAQFVLTDYRIESDPFTVRSDASQELGQAAANKIDTDLVGVFSDFTGGTVGTAGSEITWNHVFAAEVQLKAKFAPYPYNLVIHPYQWKPLGAAASVAGTRTNAPAALMDQVNDFFWVARAGGVNIYTSANITSGTSCYGGLFSRDALALDMRRAPRLEPERDASRRAWELNLTAVYAYGLWRPTFGINMLFDGTAPAG